MVKLYMPTGKEPENTGDISDHSISKKYCSFHEHTWKLIEKDG